jgi:hypothetical protein
MDRERSGKKMEVLPSMLPVSREDPHWSSMFLVGRAVLLDRS